MSRNANLEQLLRALSPVLRQKYGPVLALVFLGCVGAALLANFLGCGTKPTPTPPAGNGAAWFELHFTTPRIPTDKSAYHGGLDARLVTLMNTATKTLDVADYDFDLENVAEAMAAAKKRGVQVRMVTDNATLNHKNKDIQAALGKLHEAEIPIVDDNRGPIMHHKFTVVDGEWVQTGSWNYTVGDTYRHNNHLIIIRSRELAQNYTGEFEKMFVERRFGAKKARGVPHPEIVINGSKVWNYFAPQDKVADRVVETVKAAKESVYFMAFSFTHEEIGDAIIAQARAGLKVGGVFETTGSNTPASEFNKMKTAGLEVWTDGNPYLLHHKVIIVDERTVVLGSFNFSQNANKDNDENTLIVEDAAMAKAFKAEYERVLAWAKDPPKKK